jgi:dihydrofolate reductase
MTNLIYSAIASLDQYVEDDHGRFDWAAPDEEAHAFVNELERPVGTYLYGRRMYETMTYWEAGPGPADQTEVTRDFAAIWRAAQKVVYSRTLESVSTARTRLERAFEPEAVRALKRESPADISVGGAELAGQALAAGLVDQLHLMLMPVIVGGGRPALPDGVRARLELVDERRFAGGAVSLRYRVRQ